MLWAVAVAQPLLDLLGRNPVFFAVRGSTPREIVVFALVLTLVPPLLLTAVEALAELASSRLRSAVHLLFVGALAALVALYIGKRALESSGAGLLVGAVFVGLAAAAAYELVPAVRFAATLFLPVPVVILVLFLLASPASRLVRIEEAADARAGEIRSNTPVVLVVFDELPTVSLLNGRGLIDARRFPGFGAVAAEATWYRSATTVSSATETAVPAILTGTLPQKGELPFLVDHPSNLFTFLRASHELRVIERLTHLCPPEACRAAADDDPAERARALASDLGVVYLHLVVPESFASGLPPVGDTWSDFLGAAERNEDESERPRRGPRLLPACGRAVCEFVDGLGAGPEPPLHFFHAVLPHAPWLFLPSGRRYVHDVRVIPGTDGPDWEHDEWLIQQGYQRHLLQLGYTDRALQLIVERLRERGLWDEALVVVTADHGHAFEPGQPRRLVTPENVHGLAFVPLLVKMPGQRRGRVVDGFARTIDVVPTIADVLDAELTWDADGRSLLAPSLPADGDVVLAAPDGHTVSARLSELLPRRSAALARQHEWFAEGSWKSVYGIGPNRALIGRPVARFTVVPGSAQVELVAASAFRAVDPASGAVPSYLTGVVTGRGSVRTDLAVALNGRIAAVTRTAADGSSFAALVPDDALVEGANELRVYAVRTGPPVTLEELEGLELEMTLREAEGRIDVSGAEPIAVVDGPFEGEVRVRFHEGVASLRGWAADRGAATPAERVIVFAGDKAVFAGRTGNGGGEDERAGVDGAGFIASVQATLLPRPRSGTPVRVFAVVGGAAVELRYGRPFPWRTDAPDAR